MEISKALEICYEEATARNGLIALVTEMRGDGKNKVKIAAKSVDEFFKKSLLWESSGQATGHKKFTHKLTGVVIGFEGHGEKDIYGDHLDNLLENLQEHLNILCNNIFAYKTRNWKECPDYEVSARRYEKWSANRNN